MVKSQWSKVKKSQEKLIFKVHFCDAQKHPRGKVLIRETGIYRLVLY